MQLKSFKFPKLGLNPIPSEPQTDALPVEPNRKTKLNYLTNTFEHLYYYNIIYVDYDFSNSSRSKSSFEIELIISVNITKAKLIFDLTGFKPRTSRIAIQHQNHYTT